MHFESVISFIVRNFFHNFPPPQLFIIFTTHLVAIVLARFHIVIERSRRESRLILYRRIAFSRLN